MKEGKKKSFEHKPRMLIIAKWIIYHVSDAFLRSQKDAINSLCVACIGDSRAIWRLLWIKLECQRISARSWRRSNIFTEMSSTLYVHGTHCGLLASWIVVSAKENSFGDRKTVSSLKIYYSSTLIDWNNLAHYDLRLLALLWQ